MKKKIKSFITCKYCKKRLHLPIYLKHKCKCKWHNAIIKIIWLSKNITNIKNFVAIKPVNNETIGQCAEAALCNIYNITCYIDKKRIHPIIYSRLIKAFQTQNIKDKLPFKIQSSCGYKNGSVDFILDNGETLSLKTLKFKDGKICPQKIGQSTLKSWDKFWDKNLEGKLEHNSKRWEFIKSNIHNYLNTMLKYTFCCDNLIIVSDCSNTHHFKLYNKNEVNDKKKYFAQQTIHYSREEYEERWDVKRNKFNEMSSTLKIIINDKMIKIGEFQFHKSSRKELKFRFFGSFLQQLLIG